MPGLPMRRTPSATSRRPASPTCRSTSTIRPPTRVVDTAIKALAAGQPAGKLTIPCRPRPRPPPPRPPARRSSSPPSACRRTAGRSSRAEQTDLLALFTKVRGLGLSFNDSLGAMVKGMIQSPSFLYHWEIGPTKPVVGADGLVPLTAWQVASRLASTLWQTHARRHAVAGRPDGQAGGAHRRGGAGDADAGRSARGERALQLSTRSGCSTSAARVVT